MEKTGWIEKRQHERVTTTLKVEFNLVDGNLVNSLLSHEQYRQTTVDHLPELSEKSPLYKAVTKDISLGGLSLVSEQPLKTGAMVEISLHLPSVKNSLKFLAEICRVETTVEMGRNVCHAGLKTVAINKGDVDRIGKYLIALKKNEGKA
jgi:c-di-GMP-binding flagellar brake protein YcgR